MSPAPIFKPRSPRRARLARLVLAGVLLAMIPGCANRLFFYPDHQVHATPATLGLRATDVAFQSADGTHLHGWFCPAAGIDKPRGTVIHFHGNAQNLTAHAAFVNWLPPAGYNLFTWDYRGYGRSEGRPERAGLAADCRAAMDKVRTLPGVDPDRLLVVGQSLGGAQAVWLLGSTAQPGVRAAVIDSAFSSYRGIVREKIAAMPLLGLLRAPLSWLVVSDALSPVQVAAKLAPLPCVFAHGDADPVVDWTHSKTLARAVGASARLWILPGGGHTELFLHSEYQRKVLDFFEESLGDAPHAP